VAVQWMLWQVAAVITVVVNAVIVGNCCSIDVRCHFWIACG